jgi:spore germination protein
MMRGGEKYMKKTILLLLMLLVSVLITAACQQEPQEIESVSAWLVYWDAERALEELDSLGSLFDKVSFFAYELDGHGSPIEAQGMADNMELFFELAYQRGFEPWVTVVNDVHYDDSVISKDTLLIGQILADPVRRKDHAYQLAKKTADDGFVGLHLDYELIPYELENDYLQFVTILQQQLSLRDLGFEIIVEPCSAPIPVVEGVPVIVMAYNLHGFHSGPGPVATPEFINSLTDCTSNIPRENLGIALSLHGFAWRPDGTIEVVDWADANISDPDQTSFLRQTGSQVPYRITEDETEIWFDDIPSFEAKWQAAGRSGFRQLYIWKLGGLGSDLFSKIMSLEENLEKLSNQDNTLK